MDGSKASAIWDRNNTKQVKLKLQNNTDRDILTVLDRIGNKQGYIKRLIRDDLNGEKKYLEF